MTLKSISFILFLLLAVMFAGCKKDDIKEPIDAPESYENLRSNAFSALNRGEFEEAVVYGNKLIEKSQENPSDKRSALMGRIILGQANIFIPDSISGGKSYALLCEAEQIALESKNDFDLASVYNGMGLYMLNREGDRVTSLNFFFKGLDAAKRTGNKRLHSVILVNIAVVYYYRDDPTGLRYAEECYYYGKDNHDDYTTYIGALVSSVFYGRHNRFDMAFKRIREAEILLHSNKYGDEATLYSKYGTICYNSGDSSAAEEYFKLSVQSGRPEDVIDASLEYSRFLIDRGDFQQAVDLLVSALTMTEQEHIPLLRSDIYQLLSVIYNRKNDAAKALYYGNLYTDEISRQLNEEKEKVFSDFRLRYDYERAENEIMRKEVSLLEKQKTINWIISALLIIICMSVPLLIYYRRKSQLYTAIVKQTGEAARIEQILRQTIRQLELKTGDKETIEEKIYQAEESEQEMPAVSIESQENNGSQASSLSPSLSRELLGKFESLMLDSSVYTANDITKDKVAKMIGTNRTYLSRIINEYYGMSFTQCINNLRIREAIRRLSDPNDDIPLKALCHELGFNSISTFYTQFNAETGMTPANYRNKAKSLNLGD